MMPASFLPAYTWQNNCVIKSQVGRCSLQCGLHVVQFHDFRKCFWSFACRPEWNIAMTKPGMCRHCYTRLGQQTKRLLGLNALCVTSKDMWITAVEKLTVYQGHAWHCYNSCVMPDASVYSHCCNIQVCVFQDAVGLVRNLYLVLTNEQVRLQLQVNARQTAEQFKPVAIAER